MICCSGPCLTFIDSIKFSQVSQKIALQVEPQEIDAFYFLDSQLVVLKWSMFTLK